MTSAAAGTPTRSPAITAVRAIRRRELFRIAAADLLGLLDVEAVGYALTDVTAATLDAGAGRSDRAIEAERRDAVPTRMAIVAMGRLGGARAGLRAATPT